MSQIKTSTAVHQIPRPGWFLFPKLLSSFFFRQKLVSSFTFRLLGLLLIVIHFAWQMERKSYEVAIEGGKLYYKQSGGELLDTTGDPSAKWIFVLSTSKIMYVGKKKKGTFQHSSFLAGGAATAAGRLIVDHGVLQVNKAT